jgi:hypothetical protein
MSKTSGALLFFASSALASSTIASPPPPPPSYVDDIARQLVLTQTAANFASYASLLADDLTVTLDGKGIAASKAEWLAIEQPRLGKIDRSVYGYAEGRDNILVVDRFDDRSDERCPQGHACAFDPRYHARAVQYQLGPDHLVHAIRIVQSDGFLRTQ